MKAFFCILLLSLNLFCLAQDKADLKIVMPLQFSYNSINELLEEKLIPNAVELKLKSQERICNVYVSMLLNGNAATSPLVNQFTLRPYYTNATNSIQNSHAEVPLSEQPVLLFKQLGNARKMENSYLYSLKINPLKTFIEPGTYFFTLIFTIVPQ